MFLTPIHKTILTGNKRVLAKIIWEKINPDKWPFSIQDLPKGSALVGGSIRNVLIGMIDEKPDLDFVIDGNAIELNRKLVKDLGGKCIVLDQGRDIARWAINGWTIDFASLNGFSLKADLWRRDFRLNAIALPIHDKSQIIDPTNGIQDINRNILTAISEENLVDDPLRILRCIRLMAELNLSCDIQTREWLQRNSFRLNTVSSERIQAELQRLVKGAWADNAISIIKSLKLLARWGNFDDSNFMQLPLLRDSNDLSPYEISFAFPLARLTHLLSDTGLQQLRFSRNQRSACRLLRKWLVINDGMAFATLCESDRLQLHIDLEDNLPALIIFLPHKDQAVWLERWRDPSDPLFHPNSPLGGDFLQSFLKIPPGPIIGLLMNYLSHERAFGRLGSREEAIQAARNWCKQNNPLFY